MALRRVTSAKGWGEVCCLFFNVLNVFYTWHTLLIEPLNVKCYLCVTQVEIGAGDTHGPLFGMKIFRNLTPRLYVMKLKRTEISNQCQYVCHCNMKN